MRRNTGEYPIAPHMFWNTVKKVLPDFIGKVKDIQREL